MLEDRKLTSTIAVLLSVSEPHPIPMFGSGWSVNDDADTSVGSREGLSPGGNYKMQLVGNGHLIIAELTLCAESGGWPSPRYRVFAWQGALKQRRRAPGETTVNRIRE